jgi:hypothetical protein
MDDEVTDALGSGKVGLRDGGEVREEGLQGIEVLRRKEEHFEVRVEGVAGVCASYILNADGGKDWAVGLIAGCDWVEHGVDFGVEPVVVGVNGGWAGFGGFKVEIIAKVVGDIHVVRNVSSGEGIHSKTMPELEDLTGVGVCGEGGHTVVSCNECVRREISRVITDVPCGEGGDCANVRGIWDGCGSGGFEDFSDEGWDADVEGGFEEEAIFVISACESGVLGGSLT